MSLINDMLRNIEAKRPDDPARKNLQREIRSLPAAPTGSGRWLKPLLIAVPLLGVAILHASGQLLPLLGIDAPPVAAPAPAVASVQPPPAPVVAPADEKKEAVSESDLRMASNLAVLPLPAAPVLAVPDPVVPAITSVPPCTMTPRI